MNDISASCRTARPARPSLKKRASIAERARERPDSKPNPFRQGSSSNKSRRVDRRQLRPQLFCQPRRAEAAKIGVEIVTLRLERVTRDSERQGAFVQRRPET